MMEAGPTVTCCSERGGSKATADVAWLALAGAHGWLQEMGVHHDKKIRNEMLEKMGAKPQFDRDGEFVGCGWGAPCCDEGALVSVLPLMAHTRMKPWRELIPNKRSCCCCRAGAELSEIEESLQAAMAMDAQQKQEM